MSQEDQSLAVYWDDVRAKKEAYYGPMTNAAYPLLYASTLDLEASSGTSSRRSKDYYLATDSRFFPISKIPGTIGVLGKIFFLWTINVSEFSTDSKTISRMKEDVLRGLHSSDIEYFQTTYKQSCSLTQKNESNRLDASQFNISARTDSELSMYLDVFSRLGKTLGTIFPEESQSSQVLQKLAASHPEVHKLFNLGFARKTLIDGYFSTLEAAILLNQSAIPVSTEEARARLKELLVSNVPTEFTQKLHLSTLTMLGRIGVFPRNILDRSDGSLRLHPDMIAFLQIVNAAVERHSDSVKPLVCPFAVSLNGRVDDVLSYYNGQLSPQVEDLIRKNAHESGIKTAGQAIASLI